MFYDSVMCTDSVTLSWVMRTFWSPSRHYSDFRRSKNE